MIEVNGKKIVMIPDGVKIIEEESFKDTGAEEVYVSASV